MEISHVLKAVLVIICCLFVFIFGSIIISIFLILLAIWGLALMFAEEENENN